MHFLSENRPEAMTRQHSQQIIKSTNLKRLFDLLNSNCQISRADLVRTTGLSPTTVSALIEELLERGLVKEVGAAVTVGTGRKPVLMEIRRSGLQIPVFSLSRWGVRYTLYDLGLQELETIFVSHPSDQYGGHNKITGQDPDTGSDYADIIFDILTNQAACFDLSKAHSVCISQPGVYLEKENRITFSALHADIQGSALEALEEKLGIPVLLGNSSMAFAYAEKKLLNKAGHNIHDLIYLNVTNGIGAGIVYQDNIFTGPHNTAGELGSIISHGGFSPQQDCTTLEQEINTYRILTDVREALIASGNSEILELCNGSYESLSLEHIGEAYLRGITPVKELLDKFADNLYVGIHNIICITGIRHIVLGGGIEHLGECFMEQLKRTASKYANSVITSDFDFAYTRTGFKGDSIGIAQYYIDKEFLTP